MNDSLPFHCLEAEQGVLGCVLQKPAKLRDIIDAKVTSRWFYDIRHQSLFSLLVKMHSAGQGIDLLTLHVRLKTDGLIESVGGYAYLVELEGVTPSAENLGYYIPDLRDAFNRRRVQDVAARLSASASDPSIDSNALVDDAENALKSAREFTGGSKLPAIVDASEMLANPPPAPAELVHGLLHKGSKLVLGGGSKTFKTWTLLDLAVSVAHGEPWLSMKTSKGRVLYLNFEIQDWSFRQRIAAVGQAKNLSIAHGRLELWNLRGHAADFDALLPEIRDRIKADGHSLIVLDPIYKLYGNGLDENSAGDVARLLNAIDDLAATTGAAVAFGAHFSKGNQAAKESIDRISGSGVFARDPDSILVMTRHEEPDAFTVETTLRNFKPVEPFVVRWNYPLMRRADDLDPAKLKQVKAGRTASYSEEMLLDRLGKGMTSASWQTKVSDETGMCRRKFYELLSALQKSLSVERGENGKWKRKSTSAESAK